MEHKEGTITMLPIGQLYPHPDNPRKQLGDLTELADSIRECGVYQNLTVVRGHRMSREEWKTLSDAYEKSPNENIRAQMNSMYSMDGYTVIIGHRRLAAAKLAGAEALPCSVVEMDEQTQFRTMLIENMQRVDLDPYEQAQGFQMMIDFGDTEAQIAQKTGFSRKTVRSRLEIAKLDQTKLREAVNDPERQISLADLERLSGIESIGLRNEALDAIGTSDFSIKVKNAERKDRHDRAMAVYEPLLKKAKAKALKSTDEYGGKYDRIATISTKTKPSDSELHNAVEKAKGKKLFYIAREYCNELSVFIEHERPKPQRRPQAEIDAEKAAEAAHAELDALQATCHELRREFVENLHGTKEMLPALLRGAIMPGLYHHVSYLSSNSKAIMEMFGLSNEWRATKLAEVREAFSGKKLGDMPKIVYAIWNDSEKEGWRSDYRKRLPEHYENQKLDCIYEFLCSLGYEMSEQEKQLQDGSHRLFHLDDKEEAAEE